MLTATLVQAIPSGDLDIHFVLATPAEAMNVPFPQCTPKTVWALNDAIFPRPVQGVPAAGAVAMLFGVATPPAQNNGIVGLKVTAAAPFAELNITFVTPVHVPAGSVAVAIWFVPSPTATHKLAFLAYTKPETDVEIADWVLAVQVMPSVDVAILADPTAVPPMTNILCVLLYAHATPGERMAVPLAEPDQLMPSLLYATV